MVISNNEFILEPFDNQKLANLAGHLDENYRLIENRLGVEISNRANVFKVCGVAVATEIAENLLVELYQEITTEHPLNAEKLHVHLRSISQSLTDKDNKKYHSKKQDKHSVITTKRGQIRPRGANQQNYVANILANDITFGVGPAGTGKTYLAVACAVDALERQEVRRIVLTRPAVEAGEKLGFLPGDLNQKVDPYLRPLYDALYEMLGFDKVAKLVENNVIEVAPLAYMRGRTLNESFIIVDESQNTTKEQMKMFLTRIGYNSKAVVTGDVTQIDLPNSKMSGLNHAIELLDNVKGLAFSFFKSADVVRHPVVQRIVEAYEAAD
ncbi:MAG: phosphate starvation-inducible PhoH-like protein [Polaribacter sp.]|jgi:phosphate starvation-inducible PhoH-like protein